MTYEIFCYQKATNLRKQQQKDGRKSVSLLQANAQKNGKSVSLVVQYCGVISLYDPFGQWGMGMHTLKEV